MGIGRKRGRGEVLWLVGEYRVGWELKEVWCLGFGVEGG